MKPKSNLLRFSMLPLYACLAMYSNAVLGQACTHLGQQVTCPNGVAPGTNSSYFDGPDIVWGDGSRTPASACCSPFVPPMPEMPDPEADPGTINISDPPASTPQPDPEPTTPPDSSPGTSPGSSPDSTGGGKENINLKGPLDENVELNKLIEYGDRLHKSRTRDEKVIEDLSGFDEGTKQLYEEMRTYVSKQSNPEYCELNVVKSRFTHDFYPSLRIPKPKGKKYEMVDFKDAGNYTAAEYTAVWLQHFYNSDWVPLDTHKKQKRDIPLSTDAVIMSPSWVQYLRDQAQVDAAESNVPGILKKNAREVLAMMKCGQSGTFYNGGQSIVMGDDESFPLHLGIGSFSLYWRAQCFIKKDCCQKDNRSISGWSDKVTYSCDIKYTLYDNYNFSYITGTGGSGVLKRINPLGWFGISFHQFGYYSTGYQGENSKDIQPEEHTKIRCCELLKGKSGATK